MNCCCPNPVRAVVANTAVTAQTPNPVTLTVDDTLPVGCCFDLVINKGLLVNPSGSPVSLTDGTTTYQCVNQCADLLRYDQLIYAALAGKCSMNVCGSLCLRCSVRTDAGTPRVLVLTCLPDSCYAPVVAG